MPNEIVSLIVASDLHINSTVALCPPIVNLDDGGTYRSSRTQRWLWDCWLDFCHIAEGQPGRKVALINGDLGELDTKRRSNQIITANKATITGMVLDCLEPLLAVVDSIIIIRGTAAHTGKSAWLEEAIAQDLDNAIGETTDKPPISWWHFRGQFGGVRFDVAHHASMGRMPHTEKNAGNKVAAEILYRYCVDMEQKPPHVAIRSHNHRQADSGGNYRTFAVCTRCFTIATEYVFRIGGENRLADIGGHIFNCEAGEYEYKEIPYKPAKGKIWKAY